jgi:hypothetical protein
VRLWAGFIRFSPRITGGLLYERYWTLWCNLLRRCVTISFQKQLWYMGKRTAVRSINWSKPYINGVGFRTININSTILRSPNVLLRSRKHQFSSWEAQLLYSIRCSQTGYRHNHKGFRDFHFIPRPDATLFLNRSHDRFLHNSPNSSPFTVTFLPTQKL